MNDYISNQDTPKRMRRFVRRSTLLPFIIVGILVLGVFFLMMRNVNNGSSPSAASGITGDKRIEIKKPVSQQQLNREFAFPLKDADGKEVSKIKYEIQNAELRDEIIVKGERATPVKGRIFLILNLKVTNSYDQSIQLNSRDYVRLILTDSKENLAPEIHNDPVEVQAISTKYTRLGFTINDSERNFRLQVGEIDGEKQTIPLNLK